MNTRWSDLESKAFVVVPGFLGASDIEALLEGFDRGRSPGEYPYGFKPVGRTALKRAWARLEPALAEIRAKTRLKVDAINFLTLSHYITTQFAERTSYFHQDFDLDYRLTRDHLNYLNFWIPLRKPRVDKSNVTLVPFDALRERAPDEWWKLVGNGGHRFVVENGGRTSLCSNHGNVISNGDSPRPDRYLDFDLEEIAVTPQLAAGDLLLMRGDVIHRTQDIDSERVAASLRATYSGKVITRERSGVDRDAGQLDGMLRNCFEFLGRSEVTIAEFLQFSSAGAG